MSFVVLDPGLDTRIVDMGRPATRRRGVPIGGAADRRSLALGNALVGNPPNSPALEITLIGPHLRADTDCGCVVFGAPFAKNVRGGPSTTFTMKAGEELRIGGAGVGARAYLCVRGGFQTREVLRSRSALNSIHREEMLTCPSGTIGVFSCPDLDREFADETVIATLSGLQADWLDVGEFFNQSLVVTSDCNRMGLRLKGKPLTVPTREMVSEPVCPGAIQVTPDGQTIVLGIDGQTIGGYPKIAQVIQADLDLLGQLRPGQRVRFVQVSSVEATRRYRDAQADLRRWCMRLRLSLDA